MAIKNTNTSPLLKEGTNVTLTQNGQVITIAVSGSGGSNLVSGTGTINEITYWNGNNTISSLTTVTYPSLTELSYLKGVTSAVQNQLNARALAARMITINGTSYDLSQDRTWSVGTVTTLTTTGTSGAATLVGSTLNIPIYSDAFWSLASGGTLTGANTITGTTTNTIKFVFNGLTSLASNLKQYGAGLWLANTSSASSGTITSQQMSPLIVLEGQGYDITNSVSKSSKWIITNSPSANYGNPFGVIRFDYAVGTADPSYVLQLHSPGATETGDLGSLLFGGAAGSHTTRIIFTTTGAKWATRTPGASIDIDVTNGVTITGNATFSDGITISNAKNIVLSTTTGTKIGTTTTQKLGFWNTAPIVQPTTSVAEATFTENSGTTINDNSTFDGYTIQQVVKALRNAGLLA